MLLTRAIVAVHALKECVRALAMVLGVATVLVALLLFLRLGLVEMV